MSSIWGHINLSGTIIEAHPNALSCWNRPYGNREEERVVDESFFLGSSPQKLSKETPISSAVLTSDDSFAVVDALLFNRDEIASKHPETSSLSDEEILWYLIRTQGYQALASVNGEFAGVIYNKKNKSVYMFRDHMGVRPLYYCIYRDNLIFSTDIRGITAIPFIDCTPDENWLYTLFRGGYQADPRQTNFKSIHCVAPASFTSFVLANSTIHTSEAFYWRLGMNKPKLHDFDAYKEQMRFLITDAIQRRANVVSGGLCAELSGGLDSSVISIILSRLNRPNTNFVSWSTDPKLIPYAEDDERYVIEAICAQEEISCYYSGSYWKQNSDCNMAKTIQSMHLEDTPALQANPFVLPPYYNTIELSGTAEYAAKSGASVIFTGHGGDEGVSHRCHPFELYCHHEYKHYWSYVWHTTKGNRYRLYKTIKWGIESIRTHKAKLNKPYQTADFDALLANNFKISHNLSELHPLYFTNDIIKHIETCGCRPRFDNMAFQGSYSGARFLAPYLDYRVVDFAVSIPRHLYINKLLNRFIFREAFKDLMPPIMHTRTLKEDTSDRNRYQSSASKTEAPSLAEQILKTSELLDHSIWDQFIDFSAVTEYLVSADENEHDLIFLRHAIYSLLRYQTMIEIVRSKKYD